MIAGIFPGEVIIVENGKLYVAAGFPNVPGLTITGRCSPGILNLHSNEVPGVRGADMPTFLKKSSARLEA
jgi:hypothetical protein